MIHYGGLPTALAYVLLIGPTIVVAIFPGLFALMLALSVKKWGEWAERIEGHAVPGGHFVCEEQPEKVLASLTRFFDKHARD